MSIAGLSKEQVISMNVLAIDHGERRIGLAFKPAGQNLSLPISILSNTSTKQAIKDIREAITERNIDIVAVGIPIHPDPKQAKRVKSFTRNLRQGINGVRWIFIDESLTSQAAHEQPTLYNKKKCSARIDDRAAMLILETFIQSLR